MAYPNQCQPRFTSQTTETVAPMCIGNMVLTGQERDRQESRSQESCQREGSQESEEGMIGVYDYVHDDEDKSLRRDSAGEVF